MTYQNQVAIVTGASSGIGHATALALARKGARVVAVARRQPLLYDLIDLCQPYSPDSFAISGDLAERAFAEKIIDLTEERCGRVDILVNNAGISCHQSALSLTPEEADLVMRVNFMAPMWTTLRALPAFLRAGGGTIVNVSSFAAKVCPPREGIYAASKAALNAFTAGLWSDLEGTGIHAGIVNPGPIDTPIWERQAHEEPAGFSGHKFPPEVVTRAILEVIENRVREVTAPRANPQLLSAHLLRLVAPGLLLRGMARMEPVAPETIEAAREQARRRP